MTAKEFVEAYLHNRPYGDEVTEEAQQVAEENSLVIVFGQSDDLCELRGAIDDEVGCYNGGDFYICSDGETIFAVDDLEYDPDVLPKILRMSSIHIKAKWNDEGYSWTYETEVPHATFEIYDDSDKYCRGIVFSLRCGKCFAGNKKLILGNGISEPPYINVVRCPYDNENYKCPDDVCSLNKKGT